MYRCHQTEGEVNGILSISFNRPGVELPLPNCMGQFFAERNPLSKPTGHKTQGVTKSKLSEVLKRKYTQKRQLNHDTKH